MRFNIFDENVPIAVEKDKKINKEKITKKLLEIAKNWKPGLMLHFDEILAFILNKCKNEY